jgi:hypothetical protein
VLNITLTSILTRIINSSGYYTAQKAMADPVINEKEQPATGSERRSIDVSPTQRSPRRKPPPKLEGSETRTSTASRSSGSVGGSSTVRGTVDEHTIAGTMTKAEPGSDTSEPGGEQFSYAAELAVSQADASLKP